MKFPSNEYAIGWLAGMIDGEGSVYLSRIKYGQSKYVKISSTTPELIEGVQSVLDLIGVSYSVTSRIYDNPKWKPIYNVLVYGRENLEKMSEVITLLHPDKSKKLREIPLSYSQHRFDYGELRRMYIDMEMTQEEIAEHLGVEKWNIQYALRASGVFLSRGDKMRRAWKKRASL